MTVRKVDLLENIQATAEAKKLEKEIDKCLKEEYFGEPVTMYIVLKNNKTLGVLRSMYPGWKIETYDDKQGFQRDLVFS
ncbi:MAG: hypothetical protein WAV31_06360 [Candidatus Moraniibacteriota bacterium]